MLRKLCLRGGVSEHRLAVRPLGESEKNFAVGGNKVLRNVRIRGAEGIILVYKITMGERITTEIHSSTGFFVPKEGRN